MKKSMKTIPESPKLAGDDFFNKLWEKSWTYIKTVVDVVREPVLILDQNLKVIAANDSFYETFRVERKDIEEQHVYTMGNGQWDIPSLRKLIDSILQENTYFKGFQVACDFPIIGRKVMILNGRQIYIKDTVVSDTVPPIILLAMEDVTDMLAVADSLAGRARLIEENLNIKTQRLESQIEKLEDEIRDLRRKI